ncbi:MAG: hypothetical protein JSV63_01220 [Candidatus Aenigmatarchaeota archaeon]|nr:MAG: hypothetical protein JSV63_01220 [Candidatus Aenigmarchaeota archaeon]
MKYYGLLLLVLACLVASVLVQGNNLFASEFFTVGYVAMATVIVLGAKHEESMEVDAALGMILIFSIGFMSTEVLIDMLTNKFMERLVFKVGIVFSLDYAALGFLRSAVTLRGNRQVIGDGRYTIS